MPAVAATTEATEPWQLSEQQLLDTVAAISADINRLEAQRITLIAEIDTRITPHTLGYADPKQWLLATTVLNPAEATRILSLARGLPKHPDIADAVNTGKISLTHAAILLTFAESPPKNLDDDNLDTAHRALLDAATGPGANSTKIRAAITHLHDNYGNATPPAEDTDRNELFVSTTSNNRLAFKGNLDAVTGEKLLTALSPLAAPNPSPDGTRDIRLATQRRADALDHILDQYLATKDRPTEGGERPHLSLTINAKHLAHPPTADAPAATATPDAADIIDDEITRAATIFTPDRGAYSDLFGDGLAVGMMPWMGPLTRDSSRQLACDCALTPIIVDDEDNPLNLGRTRRTVTAKQKRALSVRDHGCAFPHCGKPAAWTDAHHIIHWIDGGLTDMVNLVLVCRHHHRLLHHSDWTVVIAADGHPWFTPPTTVDPTRTPLPSQSRAGPRLA